jgi:hypothetical protein
MQVGANINVYGTVSWVRHDMSEKLTWSLKTLDPATSVSGTIDSKWYGILPGTSFEQKSTDFVGNSTDDLKSWHNTNFEYGIHTIVNNGNWAIQFMGPKGDILADLTAKVTWKGIAESSSLGKID